MNAQAQTPAGQAAPGPLGSLGAHLGDAWGREPEPTADQSSALSLDYFRAKVTEFQSLMNALDLGYQAAQGAVYSDGIDPEVSAQLGDLMREYEGRRTMMRATAEAINLGAAAVNAAGGRMPELSIPQTLGRLGFAPALPLAAVAAIGTAAVLMSWGRDWLQGVNQRLRSAQLIAAQDSPAAAAALAVAMAQSDASLATAEQSGLSSLAPILKWGAIAVGAYIAWRALEPLLRGRGD